jgi:hypothetical protein
MKSFRLLFQNVKVVMDVLDVARQVKFAPWQTLLRNTHSLWNANALNRTG